MSLLELIARRSRLDPPSFSLPDLLAEAAIPRVGSRDGEQAHHLIVEYFAAALVSTDVEVGRKYIMSLRDHGVPVNRLISGYFIPVVHYLGDCWSEDTLSFTDVSVGMGNLMQLSREVLAATPAITLCAANMPRALLGLVPGEDHSYGLLLAAHQMRQAGWLVRLELGGDVSDLKSALDGGLYDLIGLSAGGIARLDSLKKTIAALRPLSAGAHIMVGGAIVDAIPDLGQKVDADSTAGPRADLCRVLADAVPDAAAGKYRKSAQVPT